PDAGVQSRGQHAGLQVGEYAFHQCRRRAQGPDRADARTSAEHRMSAPTDRFRGTLFVVAAPSGAGKSTLVNALLEREPGIRLSISHTTRAPRPRESEGSHYHFVSRETFRSMIDADQFFEYAEVHGDLKGTSLT